MYSTELRRDRINGLITGVAIGDALGFARSGLSRRQALACYGRGSIRYELLGSELLTGFNTARVIMAAQAIVSSVTDLETFRGNFQSRLGWYAVSLPTDMGLASWYAGLATWIRWLRNVRPSKLQSSDPTAAAILITLALHKTNLGTRKWMDRFIGITHENDLVNESCYLLTSLTSLIINQSTGFCAHEAAKKFTEVNYPNELSDRLKLLPEFLYQGSSPLTVARQFGWGDHIPSEVVPEVIMSIYCFLRHQGNFYRAVESVIRLGGDTSSTGALVGGLAGANLGINQIPQSLVDRLSNTGYGPEWIADMAHRLSEWPHGSDDLITGPPQPTHPLSVLGGNIYRHLIRVWRSLKRLGNPRRRDRGFRA